MIIFFLKRLVMALSEFIGVFLALSIELVSPITLLQSTAFILMFLPVLICTVTLSCRLMLHCTLVLVLNFISTNMVRVHYQLFGEWYSVDMPDMPTAIAFACDFVEYWFEKF